uniref:TEP1-F n=1 Tax=Epanerchodus sp. RS-2014 TaxID=1569310 RepID=A0A0E3VMX9_9MYRI|nr:alpha-2-macroglobulin [Epanerchodus sp. RS-2014]
MKLFKTLCFVLHFLSIGFIANSIRAQDSVENQKKGFILTAPSIFKTNVDENVCISFQEIHGDGEIRVFIQGSTTNTTLAIAIQKIKNGANVCFSLHVKVTTDLEGVILVDGWFQDENYRFNSTEKIIIKKQPEITIIQSDKPLYKPGQKVLFRILRVDSYFLPSRSKINSVWIENPSQVRVAQWLSLPASNGIADLNFQLSVEPQLGVWNIFVEDEFKNRVNKTFKVEEYVLPKFSVEITSSSVLLSNFENYSWKVCAHYTYGEPVAGKLKATVALENVRHYFGMRARILPKNFTLESEFFKCKLINISKSDIVADSTGSIYGDQIKLYADIIEHGTDVIMSASKLVSVKRTAVNLSLKSRDYFKPGLQYKGKIQAEYHDGSPAENKNLNIELQAYNAENTKLATEIINVKTDLLGMSFFDLFSLPQNSERITLKATATDYKTQTSMGEVRYSNFIQPPFYATIKSWYSPSNSFVQIDQQLQSLQCNELNLITVNFANINQSEIIVFYQLISRGNILSQNQFQLSFNNFTQTYQIPIMVEPKMAPKLQILVYYIRYDGEIVSDSETINVNHCYSNEVRMDFKDEKILPGSLSSLSLSAETGSLCAVSVTDKSIELLSGHVFDGHKVFSMIDDKLPQINNNNQCPQNNHPRYYIFNSAVTNSKAAFDDIGMLVITNLELKLHPCKARAVVARPGESRQAGRRRGGSSRNREGVLLSMASPFPMASESDTKVTHEISMVTSPEISLPAVEIRDFFPETWIWELQTIQNNSKVVIDREIPHSITEWSGNMFCMSEKSGLGVSPRTSIKSFQPFFLSYTMPYSVKNGETIPITVSIFNYLSGCFPVVVKLEESQFFVTDVNSTEVKLCLCGSKSYSLKFLIQPLKIGNLNVTVRAHSITEFDILLCEIESTLQNVVAFDAITKSLLVKAPGFPQETTQSNWICTNDFENGSKTLEYSLELPEDVIEGSARAFISVTGDLLGPTISGLDHLVKMPTGCGEQNMVLFVPNIYVLQYLEVTHQLTINIKLKSISYMELGYQRELNYKRDDGSYSAFGKSDAEGSIWLTSFVIKSFAQTKSIIYIDQHEIDDGIKFIVKNQLEDGCFKSVGSVIHKELQGGTGHGQSLTLFISISLLEAGLSPSGKIIKKAFKCFENHSTMNVYELSMKAYAAALANKTVLAKSIIKTLKQLAIQKDNLMYWSNSGSGSDALDIETTSYVLLALATTDSGEDMKMAIDIVRWLTKQRNAYGGFKSTQDTVLALQALVKFISQTPKINANLSLALEANDFTDEMFVTEENRLLMQTRDISVLPNMLDVQISGKGCSLIQVTLRYNIPSAQLLPAFTLNISTSSNEISNDINHRQTIKICTKYDGADNKSNMAVVEIQMITGFEALHSHLEKLKTSNIDLKRWESENDGTVELYFDQLESELKCFDVIVEEKLKVQNRKPALIKVYDYYKTDESVSKEYFLES